MTFLERLIARADGSALMLARRTRSPFEPDGDQRTAPIQDGVVEQASGAQRSAEKQARSARTDEQPRALEHSAHSDAAKSVPAVQARPDSADRDSAARPRTMLERPSETAVHPPPVRATPPIARALADARSKDDAAAPRALAAALRAHLTALRGERSSAVHEIAGISIERPGGAERATERAVLQPARHIEYAPGKGLLRPEQGMRARPLPLTAQRKAAAMTAPVIAEQPAQAPSIEISIGRVEIRAVPGAAERPAHEARPAAPKLSLEAYLRQRNGGPR